MKNIIKKMAICALSMSLASPVLAQEGLEDPFREAYVNAMDGKTVVFVPLAMGFDLAEGWAAGLREALEPLGVNFQIKDPNWDTTVGAQALTALISEKPEVIIVHNPDVQSYARLLKRAEEAGIHVLQVNMRSNYPTAAYVGVDYQDVGAVNVQAISSFCEGKSGEIAIIQGAETAAASAYQLRGVMDELKNHPHLSVVANQAANWDASQAKQIMSTVIQQHPDICGVVGFWDGMDLGTAAAIAEADKTDDIFLATQGGAEQGNACDKVEAGVFDQEASYFVPDQAQDLVAMVKQMLQTETAATATDRLSLYTQIKVITAENASLPDTCWSMN
jgi:ribose transport system substrate-binding protein